MTLDHGILNVPLSKRGRSLDAQIDAGLREIRREQREQARINTEKRKATREADKARVKLTADDVKGARFVRDSLGWHEVVRVNAKTATVKTPYSWTDRLSLDRVLEVRR